MFDMRREIQNEKRKGQEGFAVLEGLFFMFAFIILTVYTIDFFSAIHTGIVNSINARAYLFETLQHRSNIRYIRSDSEGAAGSPSDLFTTDHQRFHTVTDEDESGIDSTIRAGARRLTQADQDRQFPQPGNLFGQNLTNVIWIKSGYGICIDAACPPGD